MGYQYDVFISYRRKEIPKRWLEEMFLPLFRDYLEESLGGRKVKIFRDEDGIEGGANWSNKIKLALAKSRCMVPILIPSYFHSDWCTKEIAVLYHRQKSLGFNTLTNPNGLIIPLKIRDGIFFPENIKELQILDCNDFYRVGSGVEGTELYIKFQDKLLTWIENVAEAIRNAPEWDRDWLEDNWLEVPSTSFRIDGNINIEHPRL